MLLLGGAHLLGLRRWWLVLLVLPVLVFYALVAGGAASIWRAAIGGGLLATALVQGRYTDGLTLWSLALCLLLLIDPIGIFDISLQLSFAAAWGLIALSPFLHRVLSRRFGRNHGTQLVALTLGAQLATAPILMFHFGRLSLISLGANFIGVPLAGVLVVTGLAGLVSSLANDLNYWLMRLIGSVATFSAQLPGAQVETPPLSTLWILVCYGALLLAAAAPDADSTDSSPGWRENLDALCADMQHWWRQRSGGGLWRLQTWIIVVLALVVIKSGWGFWTPRNQRLFIAAMDVGQGESTLIRAASGRTVLIDGGTVSAPERGDVGRSVIVPYLQSLGVRKIDALVITHADADHVNGLPFVLREIPVGLVIDGAAMSRRSTPEADNRADEADYFALRGLLHQLQIPVYRALPGQQINLGDGAVMKIIAPLEPRLADANNNAAVIRLEFGQVSALFTGDIEKEAEERLARRGLVQRCTILKVAHHGSKTSSSPVFLDAARPGAAVISCGRYNAFGHPAPQTLQQMAARRVPTYRTDRQGTVEFSCDRNECWIQTYK